MRLWIFLVILLVIPGAMGALADVARISYSCTYPSTNASFFQYYDPCITVHMLFKLTNPDGAQNDFFLLRGWNGSLGGWGSFQAALTRNLTTKPNMSWGYFVRFNASDLMYADNLAPVALFEAGIWKYNTTDSTWSLVFVKRFYVNRPALSWETNQYAYKYGSFVKFRMRGVNWRYWRVYYHEYMDWLKGGEANQQELICELKINSYPSMYALVPAQQFSLYNDTSTAEVRDILGNVEFTIPYPGSLGFDANLSIWTFVKTAGSSGVTRTLLYSENITLISKAVFGTVADESAAFFGIPPSVMTMGIALSGVVFVAIGVGSLMKMTGPGYAIIMLCGILFITALGWFDLWYAAISIVLIIGFLFYSSGEGLGGVAGEV